MSSRRSQQRRHGPPSPSAATPNTPTTTAAATDPTNTRRMREYREPSAASSSARHRRSASEVGRLDLRELCTAAVTDLLDALSVDDTPPVHVQTLLSHASLSHTPERMSETERYNIKEALQPLAKSQSKFVRLHGALTAQGNPVIDRFLQLTSLVRRDAALTGLLAPSYADDVDPFFELEHSGSLTALTGDHDDDLGSLASAMRPAGHGMRRRGGARRVETPASIRNRALRLPSTTAPRDEFSILSPRSAQALAGLEAAVDEAEALPGSKVVERPAEDMELLELTYGSRVTLRAAESGMYLCVEGEASETVPGKVVAKSFVTRPFVILNARQLSDRGPVHFEDIVALAAAGSYPSQPEYLRSENDGSAVASPAGAELEGRCKWTLLSGPGMVGPVKVFDTVLLKSFFGQFLSYNGEGDVLHVNARDAGADQMFALADASLPHVPEWARSRLFTQRDAPEATNTGGPTAVLNSFPIAVQEQLLVEDLLSAMIGVSGKWLSVQHDGPRARFDLPSDLRDESLVDIVSRVLPVCEHYANIQHFVDVHSRFEFGLVSHALCSAVRRMLKEYLLLVAQLEHQFRRGRLTLQRLWFYTQPSLHTLQRLERVTERAGSVTGGALLNVVYDVMSREGDAEAHRLFVHLMEEASRPYFAMLEQWIYRGKIKDPYGEFMIEVCDDVSKENLAEDFNDTYWEQRYTLRAQQLPTFLRSSADKVLVTGKYLNVVRECGRSIECPFGEPLHFDLNQRDYRDVIERAYSFASRRLLDLLMREKQLMERLRSMKTYFLLDKGDFLLHFMDIASEDLGKQVKEISISKLKSRLELSVRTSTCTVDPFKDDLSLDWQPSLIQSLDSIASGVPTSSDAGVDLQSIIRGLSGHDAFTLTYKVRWPLTLIISRKTLTKYQFIFRHLFQCKRMEQLLCNTWQLQQSAKRLNLRGAFAASYNLRQRMLHFLQNLEYYMMVEVLEPNWHELEAQLQNVQTVDEVLRHHNAMLDKCLAQCLLTNPALLQTLSKIMASCRLFAEFIKRFKSDIDEFMKALAAQDLGDIRGSDMYRKQERFARMAEHVRDAVAEQNYMEIIRRSEASFDDNLLTFLTLLRDKSSNDVHHHLVNLATRLDYNGFYTHYFEEEQLHLSHFHDPQDDRNDTRRTGRTRRDEYDDDDYDA